MAEKIGEAYVEIRGDTSNMEADLSKSFGRMGTLAVTGGVAAAGGLLKLGAGLEDSLSPVGTLLGTQSAQFKDLTGSMKEFMSGSPMSPDEIGNAAYMTLSAGITKTSDVMATLTASQQLAQAGLGNLAGANDLVTSAMNSFTKEGLSADDAAKLFYGTIASGKTTTDALAQGFGSIAPLAAGAGVSFKDLMAATASLTATGQPASVAYSGIRGALTSIIKPSADAAETAKKLGIDFSQAHLAAVGLPAFLNEVSFATGGNVEVMGKLFGSVEGLNSVLTLTGPQAESFAKNLTGVETAGEGMADRAKEVGETTSAQMKEMVNKTKVYLGDLGMKLTGWLIPQFKQVVAWVQDNWPKIKQTVSDVIESLGGVKPFLIGLGVVVGSVLVPAFVAWAAATLVAIAPVVALGAAVAALVGGVLYAWEHFEGFRTTVLSVWESIRENVVPIAEQVAAWVVEKFGQIVTWVEENWPAIQATVVGVFEWIQQNVLPVVEQVATFLVEKFGQFVAWVQAVWPTIVDTISAAINITRDVIQAVVSVIGVMWDTWGQNLVNVAVTVFGYIVDTIRNAIDFARELIQTVMAVIRGDWGNAWDGIKGMLSAVWDQIVNIASTAGALLGQAVSAVWQGIKLGASLAWDAVKALASAAWDAMVEYVKGVPGRFLAFVGDMASAAKELGGAILSGITDGLKGLGEALLAPFKAAWNAVASLWNANVGSLSFSVPDWVPGIGGNGFDMPNLPKFHTGGVVPGGANDEVLAVLQGGERVLSRDQANGTMTAVHIEHATFETGVDVESMTRYAGAVLIGMGIAA